MSACCKRMLGSRPNESMSESNANPSLRILCLGASMTAGFTRSHPLSWRITYSPYGKHLQDQIQRYVSSIPSVSSAKVEVVIDGHDGWTTAMVHDYVTSDKCELDLASFDFCLILVGSNDVGHGRSCQEVCSDLLTLHKALHDNGAQTVAITISELGRSYEELDQVAEAVNNWMRETLCDVPGVAGVYDFNTAIPNKSEPDEARRLELWCDGLHMTEWGYCVLATSIFKSTMRSLVDRHFGVEKSNPTEVQQVTPSDTTEDGDQQQLRSDSAVVTSLSSEGSRSNNATSAGTQETTVSKHAQNLASPQ